MTREEIQPPRRRAKAQLWGGHLDGLRANVEVTFHGGPPDDVAVPLYPGAVPLLLLSGTEAATTYRDVATTCYRLDPEYTGDELLYRIERKVET